MKKEIKNLALLVRGYTKRIVKKQRAIAEMRAQRFLDKRVVKVNVGTNPFEYPVVKSSVANLTKAVKYRSMDELHAHIHQYE